MGPLPLGAVVVRVLVAVFGWVRAAARRLRPGGRFTRWSLALVVVLALLAAGMLALATHSAVALSRFERAEARRGSFVYAAGQMLAAGMNVRALDLAGTLTRLKYAESRAGAMTPGQHRRTPTTWDIVLRGERADRVRLELRGDRITRVTRNGEAVPQVVLEGEVLTSAGDRAGEDHRPVRLAEVPPVLLGAFLAAEDHRFFEHKGLDLRGVGRAAWANIRAGRVLQGGSTITQQLVKNRLLSPRRTFGRKLEEAWLASLIEWRYSKEEILESYLNEIYLGQRGSLAIRGVGAAARAYFGKEIHQLDIGEAAVLAGMARAPNTYSPAANPDRARERRDVVLGRMHELGWISEADLGAARAARITVRGGGSGQPAPYFTDAVRLEIEELFEADAIERARGARIFTTVDLPLQRFAETAITRGLDRLETKYRGLRRADPGARLQAALVALDPETGHVRALVGGRDYAVSQFNRASLARRQPGSAYKPFVFAAALLPRRGTPPPLTTAAIVQDEPIEMTVAGEPWTPRNYEDKYEGSVTVRRALEGSLNAATVRVAESVGLNAVIEMARTLGISSRLSAVPAMVLGSFEVTPLELARAYLPFANGGVRPSGPVTLAAVEDPDGTPVELGGDERERVLTAAEAYLMTSLLTGVIQSGTAAQARGLAPPGTLAGKTGTTNEGRDAWFVGYSPTLVVVVWVGFDGNEPHRLSGSEAALPIWIDFMRQALEAYPARAFTAPPGVTFAAVDTTTGKRANQFCPVTARETFLSGTEPPPCAEHGGATDQFIDWWRRVREWWRR